jgi:hypothetical protein
MIGLLVSFVVPYYVVYSSAQSINSEEYIWFEFSQDEKPFADAVVEEVPATFPGYTAMPPDVGNVTVPGLSENSRCPGSGRIYDCLFSENW